MYNSMNRYWIIRACIIFLFIAFSNGVGRVKDRIYVSLPNNHQCFRILNGTRQFGCHSNREGNIGVVHRAVKESDIDYVEKDPAGHGPFMVALSMDLFQDQKQLVRLIRLRDIGKVNGILLIRATKNDSDDSLSFSEESTCPNVETELYKGDPEYGSCKKQHWNDHGTGLRFVDFDMPIFLINDKDEVKILIHDCYEKFNEPIGDKPPKYPLCAVELTMFNDAAGNAVRCMRRGNLVSGLQPPEIICDPLGDLNVFSFIPETNKSHPLPNNTVLMLAARMDSFSMFSDYDPGSESALSNVIIMLAIMESLGRNKEFIKNTSSTTHRYLMPVLFHGESMDYIGSSRMIWDMSKKEFPSRSNDRLQDQPALMEMENLAFILEMNQIAQPGDRGYFLHADPQYKAPATESAVTNAARLLSSYSKDINGAINTPLPPSSVQRFLSAKREIPALVITDHEKQFSNKFYNSFMDEPVQINKTPKLRQQLSSLANGVLGFVYDWVSHNGTKPEHWEVNDTVIDLLMDCFWNWPTWQCATFQRIINSSGADEARWYTNYKNTNTQLKRTYVGPTPPSETIYPWRKWAPVRIYSYALMTYFLGEKKDHAHSFNITTPCESNRYSNRTGTLYTYMRMLELFDSSNDTYCFISTVNVSLARSPAFDMEGYDFASGKYSTWMESRWKQPAMRVFIRPDPIWEGAVLVTGILTILLSLIIVYLIASGSNVFFTPAETTAL